MAANGIPFSLLIQICLQLLSGQLTGTVFLKPVYRSKIQVEYGQQSILGCIIKTSQEAENTTVVFAAWTKGDTEYVIFDYGKVINHLPGYRFAENFWIQNSLNISLIIDKTAIKDSGLYHFSSMTRSGTADGDIELSVTAKYSKPEIRPKATNTEDKAPLTLTCKAEGGYPQGRLEWFDVDQQKVIKGYKHEANRIESDLFNLYSEMILPTESNSSKYRCQLFSESGQRVDEDIFVIKDGPGVKGVSHSIHGSYSGDVQERWHVNVAAPLVVIGSLIVALLLLLLYKRRSHCGDKTEDKQDGAGQPLDMPEQPLACPA